MPRGGNKGPKRPRRFSNGVRHEALFHHIPHEKKPFDRILFRTVDVFIGQELVYMAWTAQGSRWRVAKILTDLGFGRGLKKVAVVKRVRDTVELEPITHTQFGPRSATYSYLSYSAIWRTPPEYGGRASERGANA